MRFLRGASYALLAITSLGCKKSQTSSASNPLVWNAEQNWSPAMEVEFGKFVQRIGDARWAYNLYDKPADLAAWKAHIGYDPGVCNFLKDCIKNPKANPLFTPEDKALTIEADCGDVPGMMRAYFAYKKKLPYIFVLKTQEPQKDQGIFPTEIAYGQSSITSMNSLFSDIREHQHAHFYRTPVTVEHTDTYLVRIGRDTIKPGTVAYFVGGHAMMIFRIMPDGKALVIQGHPGEKNGIPPSYFTVTSINETTLPQDIYYKSGGLRNWRPYVKSSTTSFPQPGIGINGAPGPVVKYISNDGWTFAPNSSLSDLDKSQTQFQSTYSLPGGTTGNFHQYLASQLCIPGQCGKRKPTELREILLGICNTIKERQTRVESAIKAGLTKAPHPGVPSNIYEASNPWESQSSPGFDARIRSEFSRAVKYIRSTTAVVGKAPDFDFKGTRAELLALYQSYLNEAISLTSCKANVAGETGNFTLNIKDVNDKLYDMSFDPYHCPELRWGIKASCGAEQSKYYNEEVRLRNVADNGKRPAAGAVGENGANGLPIQLERGPAQPPAVSDYSIQEAINQLRK